MTFLAYPGTFRNPRCAGSQAGNISFSLSPSLSLFSSSTSSSAWSQTCSLVLDPQCSVLLPPSGNITPHHIFLNTIFEKHFPHSEMVAWPWMFVYKRTLFVYSKHLNLACVMSHSLSPCILLVFSCLLSTVISLKEQKLIKRLQWGVGSPWKFSVKI